MSTALLNESGAVTSCCEQQLHATVEQATRLLANLSSAAAEKRQQQQQQAVIVDAVLGNVRAESVNKHMESALEDATSNEATKLLIPTFYKQVSEIQPVAATASSQAPLLTLQVEKVESSVAVAGVEVEAEEEATSEEKLDDRPGWWASSPFFL